MGRWKMDPARDIYISARGVGLFRRTLPSEMYVYCVLLELVGHRVQGGCT